MLVDFDDRFNDDTVDMLSSIKFLCPREISSILHSDEEHTVDFDNLVGNFTGDTRNENMKRRCKIGLDQLKIDLTTNSLIEELNKWIIKDACRHVFKDTHALMLVCHA